MEIFETGWHQRMSIRLWDTTLLTLMFLFCVGLVGWIGILIFGTLSYLADYTTLALMEVTL